MGLFSFKRKARDDRLRKFINTNFEILLLPYWIEYIDNKIKKMELIPACFINSQFQNGALQIWTFTFKGNKKFSKAGCKRVAVDQLKIKMKANKVLNKKIIQYSRNGHFFAETSYKQKDWFTRLWTVITQKKMAHISYNCKLNSQDVDQKQVTQIVDSFRFKGK